MKGNEILANKNIKIGEIRCYPSGLTDNMLRRCGCSTCIRILKARETKRKMKYL